MFARVFPTLPLASSYKCVSLSLVFTCEQLGMAPMFSRDVRKFFRYR